MLRRTPLLTSAPSDADLRIRFRNLPRQGWHGGIPGGNADTVLPVPVALIGLLPVLLPFGGGPVGAIGNSNPPTAMTLAAAGVPAAGLDCFIGDVDVTVAFVEEVVEISGIGVVIVVVVGVSRYDGEIIGVGSVTPSSGAPVVPIFGMTVGICGSGDFGGGEGGSAAAAVPVDPEDAALPARDRGAVAVVRGVAVEGNGEVGFSGGAMLRIAFPMVIVGFHRSSALSVVWRESRMGEITGASWLAREVEEGSGGV